MIRLCRRHSLVCGNDVIVPESVESSFRQAVSPSGQPSSMAPGRAFPVQVRERYDTMLVLDLEWDVSEDPLL